MAAQTGTDGPALIAAAPPEAQVATPERATADERRRETLAYAGYRIAERVINRLPRRLVLPLAAAVGNVAYDLTGDKRRLVHENLAQVMQLPAEDSRVARTARRAFRNYAKYLVDVMRLADETPEEVSRLVTLVNYELLNEARAEVTGVLLCTVHVGGMDIIAPALHTYGEEFNVVADDTTYGRLYEHLKEIRSRHGLKLIGWRNLRGLFRALRAGESLVLFCDSGYRRGDVPVELLGEATTFPAGPATFSARTGAVMLPVTCQRTAGDRFRAAGLPLIRAATDEPAEIYRATQALADELGGVIAEDPGQWYMFRPIWPETDAERARARTALDAARRGEDWTKVTR